MSSRKPVTEIRRASAFLRTDLEETTLRAPGVDAVVVAGFPIDRCVGLTAIDAWEWDFRVILAGDAVLATRRADGQLMLATSRGRLPSSRCRTLRVKRIADDEVTQQDG